MRSEEDFTFPEIMREKGRPFGWDYQEKKNGGYGVTKLRLEKLLVLGLRKQRAEKGKPSLKSGSKKGASSNFKNGEQIVGGGLLLNQGGPGFDHPCGNADR